MRIVTERQRGLQRTGPQVVAAMWQLQRLDIGLLDANGYELLASVGERPVDLVLRVPVAVGPDNADSHAVGRASVRTGRIPPAPAVPHARVHWLVLREVL